MLTPLIKASFKKNKGCNIYLYPSNKPSAYGVVEFDKNNRIKELWRSQKEHPRI